MSENVQNWDKFYQNLFTIFVKYVIIKTGLKYTLYVSIEG